MLRRGCGDLVRADINRAPPCVAREPKRHGASPFERPQRTMERLAALSLAMAADGLRVSDGSAVCLRLFGGRQLDDSRAVLVAGGLEGMEPMPEVASSRLLADLLSLDEVGTTADLHDRGASETVPHISRLSIGRVSQAVGLHCGVWTF